MMHLEVFVFGKCREFISHLAGRAHVPQLAVGERWLDNGVNATVFVLLEFVILVVADIACHDMCLAVRPAFNDRCLGIYACTIDTIGVAISIVDIITRRGCTPSRAVGRFSVIYRVTTRLVVVPAFVSVELTRWKEQVNLIAWQVV